jgi:hypothetical protein
MENCLTNQIPQIDILVLGFFGAKIWPEEVCLQLLSFERQGTV